MMLSAPFQLAFVTTAFAVVGESSASQSFLRRQEEAPSAEAVTPVVAAEAEIAPAGVDVDVDEPPADLPSPHSSGSLIAMQFSPDPHAGRDRMEMILNGEMNVASIRLSPRSFASSGDTYGDDVHVEFCAYDPRANREDPASYPTTSAVASTDHCGEHRHTLPLVDVMRAVDSYDSDSAAMRRLPVAGMLFHEGYSGAGLVSNALATFDAALVVAEHPALRDALSSCDVLRNRYQVDDCSPVARRRLVQDVVTLISRVPSSSTERGLYLKLPSQSTAYLSDLRALYPSAAWTFVYRSPEHALTKATTRKRNGVCLKARRNPTWALAAKARDAHLDLEAMSHHDLCALHLSTLLDEAVRERDESGTGMIVSYDDVLLADPDAIVDRILPYLGMKKEIDADPAGAKARVAEVLSVKSNLQGKRDRVWNGETVEVSEEVRSASRSFLKDSMDSI